MQILFSQFIGLRIVGLIFSINISVFQVFIKTLLENNWKIIFTTREMYLNDLTFELQNSHQISFNLINIPILTEDELSKIAQENNFNLPMNEKLKELLAIPFYLSEYLASYASNEISLKDFKAGLWNRQIMNSSYQKSNMHLRREAVFCNIIEKKADENNFFIHVDNPDNEALSTLCEYEIIKYDKTRRAYFITHDIYEEWGLEKFIDYKYATKTSYEGFMASIGSSLPIRRAFRNWLSDKLYESEDDIKELINSLIANDDLESYWKDEVLVSVLLSDYSEKFFELFKEKLLEHNQAFLLRVIFMLRIACKSLDYELLKTLFIDKSDWMQWKYLLTVPKGKGWESTIKFIFENLRQINPKNTKHVLNLLDDWVSKNKNGVSTQYSGKICLHYYENSKPYGEERKQLIKNILNSASEIKEELGQIIDNIISGKEEDKYYGISDILLETPLEAAETIRLFPDKIFDLAKKEWLYKAPEEEGMFGGLHSTIGVEGYFGLSGRMFSYSPASAFQTPILILLNSDAFHKTLDFIISFVNETTEAYVNSSLTQYNDIKRVNLKIGDKVIEQYASERLWFTYRGSYVATDLLESIHMALERVLLDIAKNYENKIIEPILVKLLSKTNSASISAVIASVVTAYPDKLYNVAKILFNAKEFFKLDLHRKAKDETPLEMFGLTTNPMYRDERVESNRLEHRKLSLENIALHYQIFEKENDLVDIETKRKELCEIWDGFYAQMLPTEEQTEDDVSLRFMLARTDYRNLEVASIQEDKEKKQTLVAFQSKVDQELDEIRRLQQEDRAEDMKHINSGLSLWAEKKFRNENVSDNQYDENPNLAFLEMKEIIEKKDKTENFQIFYHALPSYISTVLIRDYSEQLPQDQKEFCKNIMLEFASMPLYQNYYFQHSDGTEPAVKCLSSLIKIFPEEKQNIKLLIVQLLFKHDKTYHYAVSCVLNLWNIDFELAQNIWLAYLKFKPKYDELAKEIRRLSYKNEEDKIKKLYEEFHKELCEFDYDNLAYNAIIKIERNHPQESGSAISKSLTQRIYLFFRFFTTSKMMKNDNTSSNEGLFYHKQEDDSEIENTPLKTLSAAFQMLPNGSIFQEHRDFCLNAFPAFADIICSEDRKNRHNFYTEISEFSRKFAYYILKLPKDEIEFHLKSLLEKFNSNENFASLLTGIAVAQDVLQEYDNFWHIWLLFYEKIKNIANNDKKGYRDKEIITNYLLAADIMCINEAKDWHSLKQENVKFYYDIAKDMGQSELTLHALAKVFNYIAYNYLDDGFEIISYCMENYDYSDKEIEDNTIYYLEQIIRRFILLNRQRIKTGTELKGKVIKILDFLIEQASVFAYMLRENIL